ncbi:protein smoothened [Pocillopora verrucosa]|uniref:protein smoothened n=1 Tax=Pocillopora verrucosa TaxID=203993 RepID=UPI00333F7147
MAFLCLYAFSFLYFSLKGTDGGHFQCEPLRDQTCFGSRLDYNFTTLDLVTDSDTQLDVEENLKKWEGLKFLSKCWSVLQPLLCQVYKPQCFNDNVTLPCREQCLATRKPCSVVERYKEQWPDFLQCERFPVGNCKGGSVTELQLNESACKRPLVATKHESSWYEGIEGCGIQCENPIFTTEEHTRIHRFVGAFGSLSFTCSLFTMITFLIGWKSQNRYPSVILFYMNTCFCAASMGFLIQFADGARNRTVCREDDTMRLQEPGENDCFLCILTFVLVYYFSLVGALWFVILAFSWSICFKSLGSTRDNFAGKVVYFHAIAWLIPLTLAIGTLAMKQVDANSLSGICFVGYKNPNMRAIFLLVPLGLDLLIGGSFLTQGLATLCKLRRANPNFLSHRAAHKIKETIMRVGVFSFISFLTVFTTFACHVYEYHNQKIWEESYRDFVRCIAEKVARGQTWKATCSVGTRPDLSIIELELASLFGTGIAMSSWTWTSNTLQTWQKLWRRITRKNRHPELSHYKIIRRMKKNRVAPAVLYPAIPEVQMDAIMKMSEAIQGQGSAVKAPAPKQDNEEPLKLKSISELTPQENPS